MHGTEAAGRLYDISHFRFFVPAKLDFVLELGNCLLLFLPKDEFPIYPPEKA